MSNVIRHEFAVLDTFSAAIDYNSSLGGIGGAKRRLESIEWTNPGTVGHTALITDDNGDIIFSEKCAVQYESIIKQFNGEKVSNLKIAISGVGSGTIIIAFRCR